MLHVRILKRVSGFVAIIAVLAITSSVGVRQTPTPTSFKHAPIHIRRNPDGTPAHGLRNQWLSGNWSGYEVANFQTGQKYTQAQLTWKVPSVTYGQSTASTSSSEYSANWVGIGGFCENRICFRADKTLIQLGTEQDVSPTGQTQYYAWYEMLPAAETPLPSNNTVSPGDTMTASLTCVSACGAKKQNWSLSMSNQTKGWTWSQTVSYGSSLLSAEWIEEAPYENGVLPLADFDISSFTATGGVNNNQTPSLSPSNDIEMEDSWGQTSNPSSATSLADFNTCWGFQQLTSCSAP